MMRVALCLLVLSVSAAAQSGYERLLDIHARLKPHLNPSFEQIVRDYSPAAAAEREKQVAALRREFDALDAKGWTRAQRVDHLLVRAQFDQAEFEFRVLRPWARDPGFYVDLVRQLPYTELPVPQEKLAEFRQKLRQVPEILRTAPQNLAQGAGTLAQLALYNLENYDGVGHEQGYRAQPPPGVRGWYADLAARAEKQQPDLADEAKAALAAVDEFLAWLKANAPRMTASAGIGREHYDWYLRRVHFQPHNADDVVAIGERELGRTLAALALERKRNEGRPELHLPQSKEEYDRRVTEADAHVRRFLAEKKFLTVPEGLGELDNNVPWIVRPNGPNFWEQVQFRDPLPDKVHAGIPGHRFDLELHERDKRPVRSTVTDSGRIEGWGFYLEEAMMHAGLLDDRPRTRELFWIFAGGRAVRNKAEVMLHTNQWTVEQAVDYMVRNVPYMDRDVARVDAEIYLRMPTYGQSYQMGKVQIEALLAAESHRRGRGFDLGKFHDDFLAAGTIPVTLIHWEMTRDDAVIAPFLD